MQNFVRARALVLLVLLAAAAIVQARPAAPPPEQAGALIDRTFGEAVSALHRHQAQLASDPLAARQLMQEVLAPHVDFRLLARLVLGHHWRNASPQQRERFATAFRDSLLATYANVLSDQVDRVVALLELSEDPLRVLPVRASEDPRRVTVQTQMRLLQRPIAIDYRMHAMGGEWQVYDIVIEGISFAASRRSEIAGLLQRQSLDQLIARLEGGR